MKLSVPEFFATLLCAGVVAVSVARADTESPDARGLQFIPIKSFSNFKKSPGERAGETILTSPEIRARIPWNELIASWNAEMPTNTYLKIEVRGLYTNHATKWYNLGLWSNDARFPRESMRRQKDADGDVDTDTLVLNGATDRAQIRLTLGGAGRAKPKLKFFSLSLLDNRTKREALPPNRAAWGKLVDVPERSQMVYEGGNVLCSATTVSMLLAHWSKELKRPALDHDVPEVKKGVYDPNWGGGGTGNWVFNTAYAGSFKGMRGYTARLSDVAELEEWIARGLPVGLSIDYNRLRGRNNRAPAGHLVICVGFTESGDVIINDPGTRQNVRKIFPRANVINAWAHSKNTAYFIYPEKAKLPEDKLGHWESATAKRRVAFQKP